MLVFLPFITTFQDILTRIILHFDTYKALQSIVVPYELKVLAAVLNFLHLQTEAGPSYIQFMRDGKVEVIYLAWNCIGWQSLLFLLVTLVTGLSGKYTRMSKFQAFLVGILGIYLINIFRMTLVVVIYYFSGRGLGNVFHNYFSNLLSISWLFLFWWMAYKYILEEVGIYPKGNKAVFKGRFLKLYGRISAKVKAKSAKLKLKVKNLKLWEKIKKN